MKSICKIVTVALLLAAIGSTRAEAQQGEWFWGLEYMVATPSSDTKNFTDDFSWRNFAIEGRYVASPNWSVGMLFGWNVFYEQTGETISFGGVDVTGEQWRYVNAFPIMATAHYYLRMRGDIRPYIGTGVGTYYIENRMDIGRSSIVNDNWHFGLMPEVGVVVPVDWHVRMFLNARYNWALSSGGVEHTYWTFGVGFGWM